MVRRAAARSAGERRLAGAVDGLASALSDPDSEVREEAAVALGQSRVLQALVELGDDTALAAVIRVMESADPYLRRTVAQATGGGR